MFKFLQFPYIILWLLSFRLSYMENSIEAVHVTKTRLFKYIENFTTKQNIK